MDQREILWKQAGRALEGVEFAIGHVASQVNGYLLPRIKAIVLEIQDGNYQHVDELKSIIVSNTPEGSGPDNDIFTMFVQVGNKMVNLSVLLWDLADTVTQNN